MLGLLKNLVPPQIKMILYGIGIAAILGVALTIWWQKNTIDDLRERNGILLQREADLSQRFIEQTRDFNEKYNNILSRIDSERANNNKLMEQISSMNKEISEIRKEADHYKKMYDGDRLAKLSGLKGGLLTIKSKSAAQRRNNDWEKAANN